MKAELATATTLETGVQVTGLSLEFGKKRVLSDVSCFARPGQLTALTGPSGSGKSSLLNCIGLLQKATAGEITYAGKSLTSMSSRQQIQFRRQHLGYLFQNYALAETETVKTNLLIAIPDADKAARSKPRLEQALDEVGLGGRLDDPVAQLSGGEQQRVALARLLLKRPGLILADEPTGALDGSNAKMVVNELKRLADAGSTVIMATHSAEVIAACDTEVNLTPAS